MRFFTPIRSTLSACLVTALVAQAGLGASAAWAATASLLPADELAFQVLQQHPQWRAQLSQAAADQARATQTRLGAAEWTPSFIYGQRRYSGPAQGERPTREWSTELSHVLRLPAKSKADEALSEAQLRSSQAQTRQQWRKLSKDLLQGHVDWLREWRTEGIWLHQIELSERQLRVAKRRQQLGDAAHIDTVQLGAAMAQAYAQKAAASQRRMALARTLNQQYPGWVLGEPDNGLDTWPDAERLLSSLSKDMSPAAWQALVDTHPNVVAQNEVSEQARAMAQQADAERRADPTVGVQWAQERSGAEHLVALNLSWPIGGDYRRNGHLAQVQLAQLAAIQAQDVRQTTETQLQQNWHDIQETSLRWQWARSASQQLESVADSLEKGYAQLGEGQLGEVLQAHRLAKDQALNTVQAECDTWLALWRWQIELGERWPAP